MQYFPKCNLLEASNQGMACQFLPNQFSILYHPYWYQVYPGLALGETRPMHRLSLQLQELGSKRYFLQKKAGFHLGHAYR